MDTSGMPDTYDRTIGSLTGLPDVTTTRPATLQILMPSPLRWWHRRLRRLRPLVGNAQTFTVRTFRHADQGDTILIETMGKEGAFRFVLPPGVADVIARQRDSLTKQRQRAHGKRVAAERKERGEQPAFLKTRDVTKTPRPARKKKKTRR